MKELWKAQEADALLMIVSKLMSNEKDRRESFPRSLKKRAKHSFKGRKKQLYENSQGVLWCKLKSSERKLHMNDLQLTSKK